MIKCEWGDVNLPHSSIKRCLNDAHFLIIFNKGHPIVVPFHDINVVCEEHFRHLRKNHYIMEFYEIVTYNEKVQFT